MAETIKIGGELESTATGNVVAAASAIKDKTKNKYQSEINDDVARHETEIHGTGGIDSRVTDLEAMEQIVIDGGEAQIAQGSDFTNPDATKRAKIPTVGAIVDGLNDGIYDVSKRNPTGGPNSDGKFTLEYILSNANTLIPTGWRHGGMSIKFIQSSDNKYVQYRLMSDTFNTTVANWQGVDDVPIAGSNNLVKSDGVEPSIRKNATYNIEQVNVPIDVVYETKIENSYIFFNGTDGPISLSAVKGGAIYFTITQLLMPGKFIIWDYPNSSSVFMTHIRIICNGNIGGSVSIGNTNSSFSSFLQLKEAQIFDKYLYSDITFNSGSIHTSGDDIGEPYTNSLRCYYIFDSLNAGDYIYFSVKTGYKIAILDWDGISPSIKTTWFTNEGKYKTENSNIYIIVGKANDSIITVVEAANNCEIKHTSAFNFIIKELIKIYDNPTNWEEGSIVISGSDIGENSPNTARINLKIFDALNKIFFYNINEGYHIVIYGWDGVSSSMTNYGQFVGEGYIIPRHERIYILGGKNNYGSISVQEGKNNFFIWDTETLCDYFKSIEDCKTEISFANLIEWEQGGVYTSGDNIGQIGANLNIRCTKPYKNISAGTGIAYNVKEGFKITFLEWDGVSSAFNKIVSFASIYPKNYGVYMTSYENVYVVCGRTNDSNLSKNDIQDNIQLFISNVLNPLNSVTSSIISEYTKYTIPYIGEPLPFGRKMAIEEYKTIPNWVNSQAGTSYGDYLVVALAMDELAAGNPNGHLYNIKTGEHISNLTFGNILNGKTYTMPHGNQICFGKEFYDENSVFPLLYVSQTTLYEDDSRKGELGVLVYDIKKVSDTEYTPVLVQAIIPDLEDVSLVSKVTNWTTNYVVDTDNNKLYLVGYPRKWDLSDIYNSVKGYYPISKFTLPKITDGEEIVLTDSMLEDNYQIYRETAIQMIAYNRGKMYIQGGFNGTNAPKYLDSVDLCSHAIVSQINLSNVRTLEPQGLFIYDGRLLWYDAGTSGKIDEFIFS